LSPVAVENKITYYDAFLVAPLPYDKATNTGKRKEKKDDNNLDMFSL